MTRIHADVLTSLADLHALRSDWEALESAVEQATIYQTWIWVVTWYEHFGSGKRLRVVTLRDGDGRLVGVAPLSASRVGPGARLVHLLGRGNDLTEYVDALLHPDWAGMAARAVFQLWDRRRREWDLLVLPSIPAESAVARTFAEAAASAGYAVVAEEQHPRVVLPLPATREAFYSALGPRMKGNINNLRNRITRAGLAPELVVVDRPDALDGQLDVLFDLHRRRARADLGPAHDDRYADATSRAFLRAVTRRLAEHGRAACYLLHCQGRAVAAQLCLGDGRRLYRDASGFDPEFARYGVMTVLFARCVDDAIARGIREFDLGLGHDQEKLRWRGEPRPVLNVIAASPRLRSRAALWLARLHKTWRAPRAERLARPPQPASDPRPAGAVPGASTRP